MTANKNIIRKVLRMGQALAIVCGQFGAKKALLVDMLWTTAIPPGRKKMVVGSTR